jgi:hypothetical protein
MRKSFAPSSHNHVKFVFYGQGLSRFRATLDAMFDGQKLRSVRMYCYINAESYIIPLSWDINNVGDLLDSGLPVLGASLV